MGRAAHLSNRYGHVLQRDANESSGRASPGQAKREADNDYADEAPRLVNAGRSLSRRLSLFGLAAASCTKASRSDSRRLPCVSRAPSRPWLALRLHPSRDVAIAARSTDCAANRGGGRVDQCRRSEPSLLRDAHAPPLIGVYSRRGGAGCASGPRPAPRAFPGAFQVPSARRTHRPQNRKTRELNSLSPEPRSVARLDTRRLRPQLNDPNASGGRLGSGIELRWRRSQLYQHRCLCVRAVCPSAATTHTRSNGMASARSSPPKLSLD